MFLSDHAMTAVIANNKASAIYRLSEDHDSTPTATWIERYKGNKWDWERMTSQPFAEVLTEYNEQGFVCLAIEE
jgi:hypothetical protein